MKTDWIKDTPTKMLHEFIAECTADNDKLREEIKGNNETIGLYRAELKRRNHPEKFYTAKESEATNDHR